jgi:hypothetical protein
VQLTSGGLKLYLEAVDYEFSGMIDYRTLRVTPAMAAGVTERLWEVEDHPRFHDSAL